MYDLGRQARAGGFPVDSCNLATFNPWRPFWLAGWHDKDAEMKAIDPITIIENAREGE
ncbi:MAG: hypothetical protein ACO23R_17295 [bacterium]